MNEWEKLLDYWLRYATFIFFILAHIVGDIGLALIQLIGFCLGWSLHFRRLGDVNKKEDDL